MAYQIRARYRTGDSFKTYNTDTVFPPVWEKLDQAKKALRWLDEHYRYFLKSDDSILADKELDISDLKEKPWFTDKYWVFLIKVPLDDDSLFPVNIPYTGYFESLKRLDIEVIDEKDTNDMSKEYNY